MHGTLLIQKYNGACASGTCITISDLRPQMLIREGASEFSPWGLLANKSRFWLKLSHYLSTVVRHEPADLPITNVLYGRVVICTLNNF